MTPHDSSAGDRGLVLVLTIGGIAAAWIAAFSVTATARMLATAYSRLGADLPTPTQLTISLVSMHLAWALALLATIAIVVAARSSRHALAGTCAAVLATMTVLTSAAMVSLALPTSLCGEIFPAWPTATAPKAVACR